jgi:hypothetical protein
MPPEIQKIKKKEKHRITRTRHWNITFTLQFEGHQNIMVRYLTTKLRGLGPQANYTDRRPPLVDEVSANLCG